MSVLKQTSENSFESDNSLPGKDQQTLKENSNARIDMFDIWDDIQSDHNPCASNDTSEDE